MSYLSSSYQETNRDDHTCITKEMAIPRLLGSMLFLVAMPNRAVAATIRVAIWFVIALRHLQQVTGTRTITSRLQEHYIQLNLMYNDIEVPLNFRTLKPVE